MAQAPHGGERGALENDRSPKCSGKHAWKKTKERAPWSATLR